ncbi:hypothetical protein RFI58_004682 [Klebsiella aerogenes]|nr:hypothetical protein [Klebsiella aerogenes]HEJ0418027.1 hypothetical protein [Klebsiella aerogenes]
MKQAHGQRSRFAESDRRNVYRSVSAIRRVLLFRLTDRVKAEKQLFLKAGSAMTVSGKPIPYMTIKRGGSNWRHFAVADREAYNGVTAKWLHIKDPKPQK